MFNKKEKVLLEELANKVQVLANCIAYTRTYIEKEIEPLVRGTSSMTTANNEALISMLSKLDVRLVVPIEEDFAMNIRTRPHAGVNRRRIAIPDRKFYNK